MIDSYMIITRDLMGRLIYWDEKNRHWYDDRNLGTVYESVQRSKNALVKTKSHMDDLWSLVLAKNNDESEYIKRLKNQFAKYMRIANNETLDDLELAEKLLEIEELLGDVINRQDFTPLPTSVSVFGRLSAGLMFSHSALNEIRMARRIIDREYEEIKDDE